MILCTKLVSVCASYKSVTVEVNFSFDTCKAKNTVLSWIDNTEQTNKERCVISKSLISDHQLPIRYRLLFNNQYDVQGPHCPLTLFILYLHQQVQISNVQNY